MKNLVIYAFTGLLLSACSSGQVNSSSNIYSTSSAATAVCTPGARKSADENDLAKLDHNLGSYDFAGDAYVDYSRTTVLKIETSLRNCSASPYSKADLAREQKLLARQIQIRDETKRDMAAATRREQSLSTVSAGEVLDIFSSVVTGVAAGRASAGQTAATSGSGSGSGSGVKCYPHEVVNRVHNWPDC